MSQIYLPKRLKCSANVDLDEACVKPDLQIGFILSPKFTLIAFASFIDCLRHAADESDRSRQIHCRWNVISPDNSAVEASCGMMVSPAVEQPLIESFDYVVVVGGTLPDCLKLPPETYDYLRNAHSSGTLVAGICTGSFILAKSGLLNGRKCAVHTHHRQQMVDMFPSVIPVIDRPYVKDSGVLTCPGGTAAIDLALALIEIHCGRARAVKVLMSMLVEKQRVGYEIPHRRFEELTSCGNWRVEKAIELMEQYSLAPFRISELSRRIGSSTRALNQAFSLTAGATPSSIWRRIRLAHSHWMLLNTHSSATEIALECGFADLPHFSRWFNREYGENPAAFRRLRQMKIRSD
jgi:transcriptional regulator GlxA family with amidase domain